MSFTLRELSNCIYWHFIHHPSTHLAEAVESSELRLAAIKHGVSVGWLDLDECMSAQCGMNVYTLNHKGYFGKISPKLSRLIG